MPSVLQVTWWVALAQWHKKKRLSTVIDRSAQTLACMYVSGGKRGLDIGISPQDLVQVVQGTFAVVVDEY